MRMLSFMCLNAKQNNIFVTYEALLFFVSDTVCGACVVLRKLTFNHVCKTTTEFMFVNYFLLTNTTDHVILAFQVEVYVSITFGGAFLCS